MSEAQVLSARRNSDEAWTVTARDSSGNPVAFGASDAIECVVWQGADSAALFSPSAAWLSAPAGTISVGVTSAQTSTLTPGVYPLEITVTPNGTSTRLPVLDCWFEVTSAPGSSLMPPVYGSYQDMIDYGGGAWLETLRVADGLSNFCRQRARARSYLDTLIAMKYRPWAGRTVHWSETTIVGPPDARNPLIRDYLAADYVIGPSLPAGFTIPANTTVLMLTDDIKEIVALKALELVCRARMTFADDDVFPRRAAYFQSLCRNRVLTTTAELDINSDGLADYAFRLNSINMR